jgi:hypothetical protein
MPRPPLLAALTLVAALLCAAPRGALAVDEPGAAATREHGPADARHLAARAELDALAPRIEALKREVGAGRAPERELTPLLARAQELAELLASAAGERGAPAARLGTAPPDAQELRERADALRDQADRVERALSEVERRLASARRQAHLAERLRQVGGAGDLFAESAPRRALTGSGASAAGSGAQPASSTPPSSAQGPAGGAPPPSGPSSSTAPPPSSSLVVADPSLPEQAASAGDGRASVAELQQRRSDLAASLAALRTRAEALEAEARAAETAR